MAIAEVIHGFNGKYTRCCPGSRWSRVSACEHSRSSIYFEFLPSCEMPTKGLHRCIDSISTSVLFWSRGTAEDELKSHWRMGRRIG